MKSKVWVLGGHGLIGDALQRSISDLPSAEFIFLKKDQLEIAPHSQYEFPFGKDDILVDLVGPPPPRSIPNVHYHEMFTSPHNQFITKALENGLGKYIFISSGGSIYGKSDGSRPFKEEDRLHPLSFYGESKKYQENHLTNECIRLNTPYVILRPSNVYNSLIDGKKHSGLIGTWLQKFLKKETLDIFGPTTITKDYISNQDIATSILKSIELAENKIINIGSGTPVTIKEILTTFEKSFGFVAEKTTRDISADDIPWMVLDVKKAESILGFKASTQVLEWIPTTRFRIPNS